MSKEYEVVLSITLTESHFVEADNPNEALEQAVSESNAVAEGGDYEVFSLEEVSHDPS